jgi:predicted nucleic acid-binding protein
MAFLLDTNILLRLVEPSHMMHAEALAASSALLGAGETVYIAPQNIAEFWNVSTRPLDKNGLGFTPAQTNGEVTRLESLFTLILDKAESYKEWRQLVVTHSVSGVNVHDARLVAAMKVNGITHFVTFNDRDFKRYTDITIMTPADVIKAYPPPAKGDTLPTAS